MQFPQDNEFTKFERAQKWADIPLGKFVVLDTKIIEGKYGESIIATIQNEAGDSFSTFLPQRLGNEVLEVGLPCFILNSGKVPDPKDANKYFWNYAIKK